MDTIQNPGRSAYATLGRSDWFFAGIQHEEALARIMHIVEHRGRCAVLSGPSGVGKTHLLRHAQHQLTKAGVLSLYVDLTGLDAAEMLWTINAKLGRETSGGLWLQWTAFTDFCEGLAAGQQQIAFLFDNVELATHDVSGTLARWLGLSESLRTGMTSIFSLNSEVESPTHSLLRGRSDLRIGLSSMTVEQTQDYVQQALLTHHHTAPVLESDAVARLQRSTCGLPREIERVTRLALIAAGDEGASAINSGVLEDVVAELLP